MVELNKAEYDAAFKRGLIADAIEPRAKSAHYDRKTKRIVIELKNGSTFAFPARLAQGLQDATEDQLAEVEVLGSGYGLHWESLNEDYTVPGLLSGIFGTRKYMAQVAGRAVSAAKSAAARLNGAKGGRPRKAVAASTPKPPARKKKTARP
jgi:hypothetical protein